MFFYIFMTIKFTFFVRLTYQFAVKMGLGGFSLSMGNLDNQSVAIRPNSREEKDWQAGAGYSSMGRR
jgi:hypothetical protein